MEEKKELLLPYVSAEVRVTIRPPHSPSGNGASGIFDIDNGCDTSVVLASMAVTVGFSVCGGETTTAIMREGSKKNGKYRLGGDMSSYTLVFFC